MVLRTPISFLFLCSLLMSFSVPAQEDAKTIVTRAEEKVRGALTSQSEMTIRIVRASWTREMSLKSWTKGQDYSVILITAPAKEKGTAFLKHKKEIWNWIPTIERTVKLPPSMMMQSWMGTDFTNDDLVRESSAIRDYSHKMLGDSTILDRPCHKIELLPLPDAAVVWGKLILFIDKKEYLQLRTEMYDEDGTLVNIMNASDIKTMGGRSLATLSELIPVQKKGQKTLMILKSIEFDKPIDDSFFTTQNMKKVK
jgi:outer membrane lipoprotein-sorting protein